MASPLLLGDPRQLGSYWLAGRIGAGGQGVVYEGYDGAGGRVAVKALHGVLVTEDFREQLRREVTTLSRVASFCTARIIAMDLDHAPPYLVSEYVPGTDLQAWVDGTGPYDADGLLRLATGVATALSSIHRAGIMHRDLKPANVLLGPDGPRVIDFGISRTEEMTRTAAGAIKGTPRWMAPEAFDGGTVTPAVDVWAWGAIVVFTATGKAPFDGASLPSLAHQIRTHEPDLEVLSEPLRSLVERALSKAPAQRPSSQELLEGLVGHEAGSGVDPLEAGKRVAGTLAAPKTSPSLAEVAERVFARLDPEAQAAVPRILLRMVTTATDAQYALRTVAPAEFLDQETGEAVVRQVLSVLTDAGLLTRGVGGDEMVTLATPALLKAWPRLRDWVEDERLVLDAHHGLADAARLWDRHGRRKGDLLQGNVLDQVIAWAVAGHRRLPLNLLERALLDDSVAAARRRRRNRALLSVAMAALLVVATGTAATAIVQSSSLDDENHTVSRQRDEAVGARVADLATSMRLVDPVTAKRLAVAAAALAPTGLDTRSALVSLYNQSEQAIYQPPGVSGPWVVGSDSTGHVWVYAHGNEVKVVDVDARRVVHDFMIPGAPLGMTTRASTIISVTADGRHVSLVQNDGTLRVWDTATGRPWGAVLPRLPELAAGVSPHAQLSPHGTRVVIREENQTSVWDTASGRLLLKIPTHFDQAILTADENHLIGAHKASLEIWDIAAGRAVPEPKLSLTQHDITDLGASRDGKTLALHQWDQLQIFHLDTGAEESLTIPNPNDFSDERIAFSSDGRYVTFNNTIWAAGTSGFGGSPIFRHSDDRCSIPRFGPGDRTLRCVDRPGLRGAGGSVTILSLSAFRDTVHLTDNSNLGLLSDDGSTLALQGFDSLEIWDPVRRTRRSALPIRGNDSERVMTRDGRLLAHGLSNGDVDIFDTRSAVKKITLHTRHELVLTPIAFSPDSRTLGILLDSGASGGPTSLELWDVSSGTLRVTSTGEPLSTDTALANGQTIGASVLFSPDGRTVVSSLDQGVVDAATGRRLVEHNLGMNQPAAFSRDGLIADADRAKIQFWDAATLQPTYSASLGLTGSTETTPTMAFSPDGQLLAVSLSTGEIRLWDVANRRAFGLPLTGYDFPDNDGGQDEAQSLAFTADGSLLLSVDSQGRLRANLISPAKIKAEFCAQFGPLSPADWIAFVHDLPYRNTC